VPAEASALPAAPSERLIGRPPQSNERYGFERTGDLTGHEVLLRLELNEGGAPKRLPGDLLRPFASQAD
jgi:hypothetical protein